MTDKTDANQRALPEKYRRVRNIEKGYEVRTDCDVHGGGHWLPIVSALHMTAPIRVSSFTTDPPECVADLSRFSANPDGELMSRRPAATE